mmetsp:Transcript_59551/g.96341  ORF Transcript_59551/g.96341 Transcript_59551/m.96341 type:complete len:226 (-) Transcript_59551:1629-2306(-)
MAMVQARHTRRGSNAQRRRDTLDWRGNTADGCGNTPYWRGNAADWCGNATHRCGDAANRCGNATHAHRSTDAANWCGHARRAVTHGSACACGNAYRGADAMRSSSAHARCTNAMWSGDAVRGPDPANRCANATNWSANATHGRAGSRAADTPHWRRRSAATPAAHLVGVRRWVDSFLSPGLLLLKDLEQLGGWCQRCRANAADRSDSATCAATSSSGRVHAAGDR